MDEVFRKFQNWFLSKKEKWEQSGIVVDKAELSEFNNIKELDLYEKDFIQHITWNGNDA